MKFNSPTQVSFRCNFLPAFDLETRDVVFVTVDPGAKKTFLVT